MNKRLRSVWFWLLTLLPLTAIITFVVTMIICSTVENEVSKNITFPEISRFASGYAYYYFLSGFVVLVPQFLMILIGRIQILLISQKLVSLIVLILIHTPAFFAIIFLLIMAIVSMENNLSIHLVGAFGMFGFIALYFLIHTILIICLLIRRSIVSHFPNWALLSWFVICTSCLIISCIVYIRTMNGIPEYIAAAMPFLYFLGFVPQFWNEAKTKSTNDGNEMT